MTVAMVNDTSKPINFSRADLDAAVTAALANVANDTAWTRAIYRAAANLAAGQFSYDGHTVTVRSASSARVYRIAAREPMRCECMAYDKGLRCWHICAARLIVRAAERHAQRAAEQATRARLADLQRLVDELF